jgi:RNA-directed DNA polymerase
MLLVSQRIADGRVLKIIESILKAGCWAEGEKLATDQGTPQGGVVSPILSNILLTPFGGEMRKKGYRLTRYADDWLSDVHEPVGSTGHSLLHGGYWRS